jgi:hypothetical protein
MSFCHGDRMGAELLVEDSPRGDHRPPNHSSPESELPTSQTTEPATTFDRFVAAAIGSGRPRFAAMESGGPPCRDHIHVLRGLRRIGPVLRGRLGWILFIRASRKAGDNVILTT